MAVDQGTLRSSEQLIDELSSLLSQDGDAKPANSNEPPHARSYIIDDEEIDDTPVPIPSTWRAKPPAPVEKGWFAEQAWAAALGFVVGLIIVVPAILFLTARFGELGPSVGLGKDTTAAQTAALLQAGTSVSGAAAVDPLAPSAATSPEQSSQPVSNETLIAPAPSVAKPPVSVEPSSVESASVAPASVEPVPVQPTSAQKVASEPAPGETGAPTATDTATETETAEAPVDATAPPKTTEQSAELPDVPRVAVIQVRPIPTTTTNAGTQTDLTARLPTMEDVKNAIEAGKVQEARRALAQLATSGNGQAVFALAETYDPNMLAAWAITNIPADPAKARMFYSMALSRGIASARQRLMALD